MSKAPIARRSAASRWNPTSPIPLKDHDIIELGGVKMEFYLKSLNRASDA